MMVEEASGLRKNFVPRILPWLLAAGTLAVYWVTLNRWVSLSNLLYVVKTSGWTWQPEVVHPVSFIVTCPFRWLPAREIPFALNLFSAVCAALTLALLARSVALLPHDRTGAQREREHSDFSLLTIGQAWLPPVFAVVVCGLQLTFWEHATNCTGEMFELLLFAFVIWSLLEYRLDEREGRLLLTAFVYGAGMANDWAMVGFSPAFIAAIVWIRGFSFFNLRFLGRMALCGLVGMSLYLLLPTLAVASNKVPATFWWQMLKVNLAQQFNITKAFFLQPDVRQTIEFLLLTSLLPVFVLAIRWRSSFGDSSKLGAMLASFTFHLAHAIFLVVCAWVAFDPPFSPRHLTFGPPFLTFYYLAALSVGYYSGYFLLVFRTKETRFSQTQSPPAVVLNWVAVIVVWLLFMGATAGLAYKNAPQILSTNDDTLQRYASLVGEKLPRSGGFLLSDDPYRLFLVQALLTREGKAKGFVPLDTQSLVWPSYHRFLHKHFPQKWPVLVKAGEMNELNPRGMISFLAMLARTNELYYLHPSFGYYFEQFCVEPHGLVYKLKTLPEDTLLPPLPDKNEIAENETFWSQTDKQAFAPIIHAVTPPAPNAPRSRGERLLDLLHVSHEQNENAIATGAFYSRSLNFWGVELQRAGELEKAAAHFDMARKLNPDNVAAQTNLQFNLSLRAGKHVLVDLSKVTPDQFGKNHTWTEVLNADGPFDEPSFCLGEGLMLIQSGNLRQAVAAFARVLELAPDNLTARLWLSQLYVLAHLPDRALEALRPVRMEPGRFPLDAANGTQLDVIEAAAYFQKNDTARAIQLLETQIARQPTNEDLLVTTAQVYMMHGLFTNALNVIDHKLRFAPGDLTWLLSKGYVCIRLHAYDDAIAALTRVLAAQTNNLDAIFNRALACLYSDKLDAARADYETLLKNSPKSLPAAYGLGEIAWRRHETNSTIKYYELYLANANTNTDEAKMIRQRLVELKGKSH
jgi:tetratricopeptide (TPR) repeat protein